MKKRQIHRGLAGFLAVLMLLQGLSVPALAAPGKGKGSGRQPHKQTEVMRPGKPVEVEEAGQSAVDEWEVPEEAGIEPVAAIEEIMPLEAEYTLQSGTVAFTGKEDAETVKAKLAKALLDGYTEDMDLSGIEFEYYCKGKDWKGVWGNTAWGTVLNEFTSKANNGAFGAELTYTHPALINNENGDYQIRLAGTTAEVTVTKETAKATITVNEGASVALVYNSDGSKDFNAIRRAILKAAVASSTPELTTDNTTIEYYAEVTVGITYRAWMPLEGGKDVWEYPAISADENAQRIRITFNGDDNYVKTTFDEVTVTFTEREAPVLELNDAEIALVFKDAATIDYDVVREAILAEVKSNVELTTDNTTIEYYATGKLPVIGTTKEQWMPLEASSSGGYEYPAMPAGEQKIKVTFKGNDKYLSTSVEATINFTDRAEAFTLNEGQSVNLVYKDDLTVDYADLYQQIFTKVVDLGEKKLTLDDVTIEYEASPDLSKLGNIDNISQYLTPRWMPLEGDSYTVPVLNIKIPYKAISEGTQHIRVIYTGDQTTLPTTKEVDVTVTGCPDRFAVKSELETVVLAYNEDGTLNVAATEQNVFNAVIDKENSDPSLTVDDVTIKYEATAETGSVGTIGKAWMPLAGGSNAGLTYPEISALTADKTYEFRISYGRTQNYTGGSKDIYVLTTDARADRFTQRAADAYSPVLCYNEDGTLNTDATAVEIFKAILDADNADAELLAAAGVTMEYSKTDIIGPWHPLDHSSIIGAAEFGKGVHYINITWKGTDHLKPGSVSSVKVDMIGRVPVAYTLKDTPYSVVMVYTAEGKIDYTATAKSIYAAVVATTDPEDAERLMTVEYSNTPYGPWHPLDYSSIVDAIVFGVGDGKNIRIIWADSALTTKTNTSALKVNMTGREDAVIAAKDSIVPVTLTVNEDLKTNYKKLRKDLYEAIVDTGKTTEGISLDNDDVTFAYKAPWIPIEGVSAGDFGTRVMPLEGGTYNFGGVNYKYAPISAGTQEITISWPGNAQYNATSLTVSVEIKDREQVSFNVNDNAEVSLVYKEVDGKLVLDFDAIRTKIFKAVVNSTRNPVGLTAADVTIQYNANKSGAGNPAWEDLEKSFSVVGQDLVKFGTGSQKIKIAWGGNQEFLGGSVVVTVNMTERETAPWTEKQPNASVKLPLNDDLSVNYEQLYQDVFNAIVESSDVLTAENVTIEYLAPLTTGTITDYDKMWMPLEGGKIDIIGETITAVYKPISEGEQKIRISWPGNVNYAPTTIERTLAITDRPVVKFNVVEQNLTQPCEVGMAFNPDMTYDYEQTAKNIFNTVVTSVTPDYVTADMVNVEYRAGITDNLLDGFVPLNQTDITGAVKFGMTVNHEIRISWAGDKDYKGASVTAWVKMVDGRLESSVVLNDGTFTYSPDKEAMKRNIYSLIDWNNSKLPEGVGMDSFTIEYEAMPVLDLSGLTQTQIQQLYSVLEQLSGGALKTFVPVEGKVVNISDLDPTGAILKPILDGLGLGDLKMLTYPKMGAGENQTVRVTFNGDNEYRPSAGTATVTVEKASVKVSVNSTNIRAGEAIPGSFITTNPVDDFDVYTIYAGMTSNITTAVYLDLPDSLDNSIVIKALDPIVKQITGKSFTEMMNNGITVGELRGMLRTQELLDVLNLFGIDTSSFEGILSAIDGLAGIVDGIRVGFGAPNNRAGLYTVIAVTDSPNYNTGVGMGFLLVRMNLSGVKLTWNQALPGYTISQADAQNFDFGATLSKDGDMTIDQSSVSYLYSGFTSKWRVYSSTTTPPREPGSYVMTVCLLGGNYMAAPITRSFRIK